MRRCEACVYQSLMLHVNEDWDAEHHCLGRVHDACHSEERSDEES